jgi:hypothetical protein
MSVSLNLESYYQKVLGHRMVSHPLTMLIIGFRPTNLACPLGKYRPTHHTPTPEFSICLASVIWAQAVSVRLE